MALTLGHRWPMRSNLQHSNGHDSLLKFTCQNILRKSDLNLPNMCFRLSIWPNGHRESQKYDFVRGIPRTNEVAGLVIFYPNSSQNNAWVAHESLIWSPKYKISSPKLVPTQLILLGTSQPCIVQGGLVPSKTSYFWLTVTRAFQRVKELSFECAMRRPNKCLVQTRVAYSVD
jgi:hypothetical protein